MISGTLLVLILTKTTHKGKMSGHIGDYRSKSRFHTSQQVEASGSEILINKTRFYFKYGGGTWTTGYNLPAISSGGATPLRNRRWYRLRMNYGDYRWNSECIVLQSDNYFGTGGNLYNHWNTISVSTTGAVSCVNGNGGSTGDLYAELLVWEIFGRSYPHHYTYIGDY